jgi:hypothetical protein
LLLLAVDHLSEEKIVVILDSQERADSERLVEFELGPALADVSDFALKKASCSKHIHDGGLTELMALTLPLIRVLVERDGRFQDDSLPAHKTCSAFLATIAIDREP